MDITPAAIEKLTKVGGPDNAAALNIIITSEIGHVAFGKRWFYYELGLERLEPANSQRQLATQYLQKELKPTFHIAARRADKFSIAFEGSLAVRDESVALTR